MAAHTLDRRRFLTHVGLGAVAFTAGCTALGGGVLRSGGGASTRRWGDPTTWGGRVPGPADDATVVGTVVLDSDATVHRLTVARGGRLVFDPAATLTLTAGANVEVQGVLEMQPASADVHHRLAFVGIDERRFVGGGMDLLESDVGVWVLGEGRLALGGTPKLSWTRTAGGVAAGATALALSQDPVGWRVGDEIALTPTGVPTDRDFATRYDVARIAAISGRTVSLAGPIVHDHPAVDVGRGVTMTPEVLNLSRNVEITGQPGRRAHVLVRSTGAQVVEHTLLRHLGPRRAGNRRNPTVGVPGRFMLHFHHCEEGSRGSRAVGVVARDGGNHAFVAHVSHGVTFTDCISHDTYDDAYWWNIGDPTDDLVLDRCVASLVRSDPDRGGGFRLAGFRLGTGDRNVVRDCVAVGVLGSGGHGYQWGQGGPGVWDAQGCVAHDNRSAGIFVWHNTNTVHTIRRFVVYHCGRYGIEHGAYRNPYRYEDLVLYGNLLGAVLSEAFSGPPGKAPPQTFSNVYCDQAGLSEHAVVAGVHRAPPEQPVRFEGCELRGYTVAALGLVHNKNTAEPERYDLVGCTFSGNQLWIDDRVLAGSLVRIQGGVPEPAVEARRRAEAGTYRPEWNAAVTPIAPFA